MPPSHLHIITYFLQQGFDITEEAVNNAIEARSTAALELFLAYGWDINRRRPIGWQPAISTPLTIAVMHASLSIVKLLIAHGARLDHGNLLSSISASNVPGRLAILGELVEKGAPINELHDSQNRARVRIRNWASAVGTPLHRAVDHGRVAIAAALLAHGADKTIVDTKGRTPLEFARELGAGRMVELLEEE
ncbi:hypothetical protein MMC30_005180 [Trapelia coarctata]|nr:hypothetical protein [Trapelia coarctata]